MSTPGDDSIEALMQSAFGSEDEGFERLDPEARATLSAIISQGLATTRRPTTPLDQNEISIMARFHQDEDAGSVDRAPTMLDDWDGSEDSLAELESVGAFLAAVEGQDEGPPAALMEEAQALWRPAPSPKKAIALPSWAQWLSNLSLAPALAAAGVAIVVAIPVGMAVVSAHKSSPFHSDSRAVVLAEANTSRGASHPPDAAGPVQPPTDGGLSATEAAKDPAIIAGPTASSDSRTVSALQKNLGDPTVQGGAVNAPMDGGSPGAAATPDGWSAIAVSASGGAFGVSAHQGSQSEADAAALAECAKNGATDCKVRRAPTGRCAALASAGGRIEVASGATLASARASAAKSCQSSAGVNCRIEWNACGAKQP